MEDLQNLNIEGMDINISEPVSKVPELTTKNIEPIAPKNIEPKTKSKRVTFNKKEPITCSEDNFNIYGFVVPKSTAYLTIILFIIGFIIWYITYYYDQKNKSKDNKE
jgi:hypothetical protein